MTTTAKPVVRILGIDPGLRLTGFGVIEQRGPQLRYVTSGVIRVPDGELPRRLAYIFTQINALLAEYQPTHTAIEKVFVNVNPASTLLLGQARGAAITALAAGGLPVAEYTALQIKQSVVGYGRATKEQIQQMMVRLLDLPGIPGKDAADALACAVCHAHAAHLLRALDAAATATDRARAASPVSAYGTQPGAAPAPAGALQAVLRAHPAASPLLRRGMRIRRGRLVQS